MQKFVRECNDSAIGEEVGEPFVSMDLDATMETTEQADEFHEAQQPLSPLVMQNVRDCNQEATHPQQEGSSSNATVPADKMSKEQVQPFVNQYRVYTASIKRGNVV